MTRRAFTLVEVLVAIALIVALGSGLYAFAWGLIDRRERVLGVCESDAAAEAMFEELETLMPCTFVADGRGRAGIAGGSAHLTVRGRGVRIGEGEPLLDEAGATFRYDAASSAMLGTREGGVTHALGRMGRVTFRYFDGTEWLDAFDSAAAGRLPVLVEVRLWLQPGTGTDESDVGEDDLDAWGEPDRERIIAVPDAGRAEVAP